MSDSSEERPEDRVFSLEPEPEAPPLPGTVIVRRDDEDLHSALAADLMIHAQNCVRSFGDFHLALSGGGSPLPFYTRLMVDPAYRGLPWKRTHLWIVDERRVPAEDDRSNFKHIAELLVDHSGIPLEQVHPIEAMREDADAHYESVLRETLGWRERGHDRLDFVLLGMGSDGHTASLFPRSPALEARDRLVLINKGPTVTPPERVTMTLPLINGARFVAVLVKGGSKRGALARAADERESAREIPIRGVSPVGGVLRWYVDWGACGG